MLKKSLDIIRSLGTGVLATLGTGAVLISIITWIYQVNATQRQVIEAKALLQVQRSLDSTQFGWNTNVERILFKLAINDSLQRHDIHVINKVLHIPE